MGTEIHWSLCAGPKFNRWLRPPPANMRFSPSCLRRKGHSAPGVGQPLRLLRGGQRGQGRSVGTTPDRSASKARNVPLITMRPPAPRQGSLGVRKPRVLPTDPEPGARLPQGSRGRSRVSWVRGHRADDSPSDGARVVPNFQGTRCERTEERALEEIPASTAPAGTRGKPKPLTH